MTLAQAAEKDFADHFRANGFTALNLGMNGYSTLHYRDAFRKFVFEPKIQVRYLIVVISGFNDHHDSLNYARTSDATGDFRRYLGQTPSLAFGNFQSPFVPWTVSILGNAIPMIKNVLTGKVYGSEATVELDYTTVTAGRDILQVDPITENDLSWRYLFQGLNDLLDMAAQKNIRTLIAYYPPTRLIVGPYLKGFEELRAVIQADHRELMALYRRTFNGPTVRFVDLTEFVSKTAKGELVTLTPLDYHLNARGVGLVAGKLLDEVRRFREEVDYPATRTALDR